MLTSFILINLILLIITIIGWILFSDYNSYAKSVIGGLMWFIGTISLIVFFLVAGIHGEFGYNTYKETSTTNFSKALANDHSSVTIIYNNKPYVWLHYNVVYNFDSITNIIVCERTSVLGCQVDETMKIVTPPYKPEEK